MSFCCFGPDVSVLGIEARGDEDVVTNGEVW
eukprot:CAMPEP_0171562336 /NCGR_PEP_ID=MMETSP0960-20121227/14928_1 /TAXON_ID=87120 /ORGANISM="Aurantiochytrium limacinum, Strain ATCCMYA-1381" /LENGTH=30 /DNA_ID= /DNA_START= /DNA_END= /DNA_ORIENTATION=